MKKSLLVLSLLVSSAFADNLLSINLAKKQLVAKVIKTVAQDLKTHSPTNSHIALRRLLETFYDQLQQTFKYNIDDKRQNTIVEIEQRILVARKEFGDNFLSALTAVNAEIDQAKQIVSKDDDNQATTILPKLQDKQNKLEKLHQEELVLLKLKQRSSIDKELFVVKYLKILDTTTGGRIDRFFHKTNAMALASEYPQDHTAYTTTRDYIVSSLLVKFVIQGRDKLPSQVIEYFKEDFEVLNILDAILDKHLSDVFVNIFKYDQEHFSHVLDFWNDVFDWSTEETQQLFTMDFLARFSNRSRPIKNSALTKEE